MNKQELQTALKNLAFAAAQAQLKAADHQQLQQNAAMINQYIEDTALVMQRNEALQRRVDELEEKLGTE